MPSLPSFSIDRRKLQPRNTPIGDGDVAELNDAMDKSLEPGAVLLPAGMTIREGQELWEGVKFGRLLGAGVQARVFELVRSDGTPSGKVIKVAHADLGHKILNSPVVWIGGEREWEIGIQMRVALQNEDGTLPGFMRVYDCVVVEANDRVTFTGMTMEKLQGWEVHKRLLEPDFHNIHYVREMLYQSFSALAAAQRKLGFHHADLGMRNIMECYPRVFTDVAEEQTAKSLESLRQAESSGSDPAPGSPTSSTGEPAGGTSAAAKLNAADADLPERHSHRRVKPVRGFTCSASGEMLPLGPQVEFKIIDYGVAIFDERLAESTGGTEYKGVLQRIKHVVAAKEVVFPSREGTHPGINRTVPLQTSAGAVGRASHAWHLLPTKLENKFRVKQTPVGAFPVVSDESFTEAPAGVALGASKRIPRLNNATRRLMKESGFALDDPLANPQAKGDNIEAVSMSPVESMYRNFWRRKGDVFHILLSVGMALDNRVWPKHDEDLVNAFISLVFHCTGVKVKASFAAASETGTNNLYGTLDRAESLQEMNKANLARQTGHKEEKSGEKSHRLRNFGVNRKWYRPIRRYRMMFKAHIHPYNSGMTANEALVAPFFGRCQASTAAVAPVDVESVFPGAVTAD
ncbi:hypothetical protein ACKKBG_A16025 [Auxenochlorella protothecoides x Auxenochlorella symbiontica]